MGLVLGEGLAPESTAYFIVEHAMKVWRLPGETVRPPSLDAGVLGLVAVFHEEMHGDDAPAQYDALVRDRWRWKLPLADLLDLANEVRAATGS